MQEAGQEVDLFEFRAAVRELPNVDRFAEAWDAFVSHFGSRDEAFGALAVGCMELAAFFAAVPGARWPVVEDVRWRDGAA